MRQLIRYLIWFLPLFAAYNSQAQNNTVYGAGISYTNGAPTWTPNPRTSRAAVDTVTGRWYHFNTPGGWQWIGNTVEEIAGCAAPAYTPSKGDSRLVINNCAKPQAYWYDGLTWKWINEGTTYFAGEGIRIENDTIILDSLYVLRFRTGDTTDLNAGAVSWNAAEQTIDVVINQGAVTGQMFQEVLYFTKNQTGAQIDDGTVVMAAGTTGNSGKILIAPAIADGSVNSEYILGLATQNLPNGGEGMVTHFGKVRGIQTNGANFGETWVDGDVLYCSAATPGYLTKVLPTAPNLKVPIAIVIHAHPSNGTLFVRPSHFPDLAQINDVQLSSPTNGQVLTYNSTLSRWENATPANQLQTLSTDNTPGNISISSGNTITLNVNDADASATNELQTLSVAANTATLSNSGGSVTIAGAGINTVGTAGTTITVTGTEVDGSTTNELQTLSTGTNTLTLSNGGGTVTVDTDPSTDVTGSGANGRVAFWTGGQTQSGNANFLWDNTNNRVTIGPLASATYPLEIFRSGAGETYGLNISMRNPGIRQEVKRLSGGAAFFLLESRGLNETDLTNSLLGGIGMLATIASPPTTDYLYVGASSTTAFNDNSLRIYPNKNATIEGSVRIGGHTAPAARLHVVGSGTSSSTWTAQFHNSGGANNALMIRDDGNVGIGTNAPGARLQINTTGTTTGLALNVLNNSGQTGLSVADNGEVNFGYASLIKIGASRTTFGGLSSLGPANQERFQILSNAFPNVTDITDVTLGNAQGDFTITSGMRTVVQVARGFGPTSGTGAYNQLRLLGTINQTGGANGITRGLWITPTLTSAADWRSIQWDNSSGWGIYGEGSAKSYFAGNVAIGTTTQNASAALEVASTTQGVLFPRMTTTQRNAIATPADGLVIYNTTDNKLQVRAGGAWVDLH